MFWARTKFECSAICHFCMKVWELDSKANDVTRSKMLTKSATFHQINVWCHQIKSKQKFCTRIGCRLAVNITKLRVVLAFHKLIVAHLFKKFTSFYTARISVIHLYNSPCCIQS